MDEIRIRQREIDSVPNCIVEHIHVSMSICRNEKHVLCRKCMKGGLIVFKHVPHYLSLLPIILSIPTYLYLFWVCR